MGVHGDKTVVGGKTSTLNSLSPINNKKKNLNAAEISSNSKSNSKKAGTSSSAAAGSGGGVDGIRSNASKNVDANMAPALTEPRSPTEKLSSAAAAPSVSPAASTISTENDERKLEVMTTTASTSRASPANREKRNTARSAVSTSTRVTRSKDNAAAAQERANTPSGAVRESPTAPTSIRKSKRNSKEQDNEQMGLSAATPSATLAPTTTSTTTTTLSPVKNVVGETSTSSSTSSNNNNNNIDIVCKDNSTAQLLADLTTDFEETITAEICLRKQLPEVKVTTPDAAQLSASSETESETTASKSAGGGGGGGEAPDCANSAKHMESTADIASGSNVCKTDNQTNLTATVEFQQHKLEKHTEDDQTKIQNAETDLSGSAAAASLTESQGSRTVEAAAPLEIQPINSDSTMTASEEEPEELDALEAKLSQLDGSAIENPIAALVDDAAAVNLTPTTFATTTAVHTPPQSQQLQPTAVTPPTTTSALTPTQQLLLTPTGSTSSSHMLALTPQSTSSLLREVNAVGAATSSGGGELEDQELEEVLKALKGFDANAAGAEGVLSDLNVLLNEVYTTFNCDEMTTTNSGAGANVANIVGNIGSFQQQTQMTNLSASTSATAITKLSTSPLKELHVDIEKKQQLMQRKIDIILRRLRKLQVRYMSKHTTEEIAGLFELAARITHKGTNNEGTHSSKELLAASVISARPPPRSWEEDLKTAISSTEMLNLLERLEKSANSQQICTTTTSNTNSSPTYASPTISAAQQMRKTKKISELASGSAATSSATTSAGATSSSCTTITAATNRDSQQNDDCVIPVLNPQIVDELTHVTGMLRAEMRDIQVAYDSDATESSSGGESADEMVAYNNQVQQSLSIVKRAAWRYSRERAAIASRWSWLLSQIADLEIKIRQHSELFQEVVRSKGAVVCEEELSKVSTASKERLINAYGENEETVLPGACRTRGFLPSQFRKRKMLQTTSLHTISKKAARPSTIKCGCQCPLNPCALCTGRTDPTAPRDLPDTMIFPERVALLDPGFHPVLSFSDNVSNSIHFEAIARTPHWQNRIVRIQPKSVVRSVWKAEREAANLNSHHSSRKYGDILMPTQKRRYIRRKERNTNQSASTNLNVGGSGNKNTIADLDSITTASTDFAKPATALGSISTTPIQKHPSMSKMETSTPTSGAISASGNGTATLFTSTTSTTTPLVANKMTSNNATSAKRMHCLLVGDGTLLEPLSPSSNNSSTPSNQANSCQTPQNYDPYNPSQTPSSLISNSQQQYNNTNKRRHYKQRKSVVSLQQQFSSNSNNNSHSNYHTPHQQPQHHNNTHNNNSNGDISFDYWDTAGGGRSRTASPTHGTIGASSSNYHKYERSLERRNRISYDIDNIVIPYSVAAATRVEILPYKEIPTPKWRVFDDELAFDQEKEEMNLDEPMETVLNEQIEIKQQQMETTVPVATKKDDDDDQKFAKPAEAIKLDKNTQSHTSENETKKLLTSPKAQICDKAKENCAIDADAANIIDEHTPPLPKKAKVDTLKIENDEKSIVSEKVNNFASDNCSKDEAEDIISAADLEEDISDETLTFRHERALHEERRKFQTYLKFPWSTRSRANRRIDSRAESSGANTPDPASPAPNTPSLGGGDQESIPSPLAPSTPLTPLDAINETPESGTNAAASIAHSSTVAAAPPAFPLNVATILNNYNISSSKRNERRRTTSTRAQYSAERSERRSLTPDSREIPSFTIPPYEPLKFPLDDEAYETLASVTYLPPSVSNFYGDGGDFNKQHEHEQQHNSVWTATTLGGNGIGAVGGIGHYKTVTPRNGRRTTSTSKAANVAFNCDLNGKKRRPYRRHQSILDAEHKVADSNEDDVNLKTKPFINGQSNAVPGGAGAKNAILTAYSTDIDDEFEDEGDCEDFYDELAEDDDDGYPKHPLAPGSDIDNLIDDEYDSNGGAIGGANNISELGNHSNNHLGSSFHLSDSEISDPDPFEDDDPNDPEWKGESSNKAERHSERLRKRSYF